MKFIFFSLKDSIFFLWHFFKFLKFPTWFPYVNSKIILTIKRLNFAKNFFRLKSPAKINFDFFKKIKFSNFFNFVRKFQKNYFLKKLETLIRSDSFFNFDQNLTKFNQIVKKIIPAHFWLNFFFPKFPPNFFFENLLIFSKKLFPNTSQSKFGKNSKFDFFQIF